MLKLIGLMLLDASIVRKIVAISGIGILMVVGMVTAMNHVKQEGFPLIGNEVEIEWIEHIPEPMKLISVCSPTPAKMVSCTWIPLEEKFRLPVEQALFDNSIK